MANGNEKGLHGLPNSIKRVNNELSKNQTIDFICNNQSFTMFYYPHLQHRHASQFLSIQTYLPQGENMGRAAPRSIDFSIRLQKEAPNLQKGGYILLECEGENIVVVRTEDRSLLSDIDGTPATLLDNAKQIGDDLEASTFFHNTPLAIEALGQYTGRQIDIILDKDKAYTIEAFAAHHTFDPKKKGVPHFNFEERNGQPHITNEMGFHAFLNGLKAGSFGIIHIPNTGDFVVQPAEEHPYAKRATAERKKQAEAALPQIGSLNAQEYDHHFWSDAKQLVSTLNTEQHIGVIRDKNGEVEAFIMPAIAKKWIENSKANTDAVTLNILQENKDDWLSIQEPQDVIEIDTTGQETESAFIISKNVDADLATALGIDQIVEAAQKTILVSPEETQEMNTSDKVKRLRYITMKNFEQNPKKYFKQIDSEGIPTAIRAEDNSALVILMPRTMHDELRVALGGAKKVLFENMQKDIPTYLEDIQREVHSVEIGEKNNGMIGLMVSGDNEELIANNLPDAQIIWEEKPEEEPTPTPPTAEEETVEISYSYQNITYSRAKSGVARLRAELKEGQISILADTKKGLGVFIPESLMNTALPDNAEWVQESGYAFTKQLDSGDFLDSDFDGFIKIQPGETPFKNKADFSSKDPYGFIPWPTALQLEQDGVIPTIPEHVKQTAQAAFERLSARKALVKVDDVIDQEKPWSSFESGQLTKTIIDINETSTISALVMYEDRVLLALPSKYEKVLKAINGVNFNYFSSSNLRQNMAHHRDSIEPNEVKAITSYGNTEMILLHPDPANAILRTVIEAKPELEKPKVGTITETFSTSAETEHAATVPDPVPTQEPEPAPASPPKPSQQPPSIANDVEPSAIDIDVGSILHISAEKLNVSARLKMIQAAKKLDEAISNVRNLLKENDGFLPVTIGNQKAYVTANPELVENTQSISEIFGLSCECTSINTDSNNKNLSQWAGIFKKAVANDNQFTIVQDPDLGRDVVIIPDNKTITQEVLPQLGIELEF